MSAERDELAKVIETQPALLSTGNDQQDRARSTEIADAILAAGYRKPRIIHTAEELDHLPEGSLIVDSEPDVLTKVATGKWVSPKYVDDSFNSRELDFPITVVSEATK